MDTRKGPDPAPDPEHPSMELVLNYARGIADASDGKLSMDRVMRSDAVRNYASRVGINL